MWVQFREGSTFRDVEALAAVLTEDGVDPRHCLLVTDDVLPGHDRRRRAHGPGPAPRRRGRHRSAGRDPDGDGERRGVLRHAARPRLDRAGAPRRHPVRRGPRRLPAAPGARRRPRAGRAAGVRIPGRGVRVDQARPTAPAEADLRVEAPGDVATVRAIGVALRPGHDRAPDRRAARHRRRGPRLGRGGRREAGEHRAPRRSRHGRGRLRQGTRAAPRRGRELDRPRQPQPARRRHERRRHAVRRRPPGRGGRRDGRRRRRRGARPGRAARSPA